MRVVAGELKKIWNIRILGIITLLCLMYFLIFMLTLVTSSPRGTWFNIADFAHHLTEVYGTTLEPHDFEDFLQYRGVIVAELDEAISENPTFADAGIYNFHDYLEFAEDFSARMPTLTDAEISRYNNLLNEWFVVDGRLNHDISRAAIPSHHSLGVAYSRMQSYEHVVGLYRANVIRDIHITLVDVLLQPVYCAITGVEAPGRFSERQIRRLEEIRDSGELVNIIDNYVVTHTSAYGLRLAILIILVTLILVSPLIVTDRVARVNALQYSSKQGRSVIITQFIAIIISALGMTTIFVIIFSGIFSVKGTWVFWNNGINSFMNHTMYWLSITYGQYVLLMIAVIYVLSIISAAAGFIISWFSKNNASLVFKLTPLFIAGAFLAHRVLHDFLSIT
ncbi:MAG: hypothetical protein FWE42_04650 [Defluviitaleaceae bacterium]|nr:hypothetical protein [Defluviitaleaceae bacterium]